MSSYSFSSDPSVWWRFSFSVLGWAKMWQTDPLFSGPAGSAPWTAPHLCDPGLCVSERKPKKERLLSSFTQSAHYAFNSVVVFLLPAKMLLLFKTISSRQSAVFTHDAQSSRTSFHRGNNLNFMSKLNFKCPVGIDSQGHSAKEVWHQHAAGNGTTGREKKHKWWPSHCSDTEGSFTVKLIKLLTFYRCIHLFPGFLSPCCCAFR